MIVLLKKSGVLCFILRAVETGRRAGLPLLPPEGRSVNPIPTEARDRLCPPCYYSSPGFSTLPTALSILTYKYLAFVLTE